MTPMFSLLGYNYSDPHGNVTTYSANTIEHLEAVPPLIEDWQSEDIATSNVGGYFQNPLNAVCTNIRISANSIQNLSTVTIFTDANVTNVMVHVANSANTLKTTANNFIDHTDRVSGTVTYASSNLESNVAANKPFRDTISGFSKLLVYVLYQTDEIVNNSIIMGSQTSLFTGPEMNTYNTNVSTYISTINSSILPNLSSNLTMTQANTINTGINEIITFMDTRRTHDETFFINMKTMVANYQETRQFSDMGATDTYLVNNFTGTNKLLTRIN